MSQPLLKVTDLAKSFSGVWALSSAQLTVGAGEIHALLGENGAGKSTLMNAIGGFVPADGSVELAGTELGGRSAAARARLGLGRTFQSARIFPELTVLEAVQVALEARGRRPDQPPRGRAVLPPSGSG